MKALCWLSNILKVTFKQQIPEIKEAQNKQALFDRKSEDGRGEEVPQAHLHPMHLNKDTLCPTRLIQTHRHTHLCTHTESFGLLCQLPRHQPKFISKLWRDKMEGRDRESESVCGCVYPFPATCTHIKTSAL